MQLYCEHIEMNSNQNTRFDPNLNSDKNTCNLWIIVAKAKKSAIWNSFSG